MSKFDIDSASRWLKGLPLKTLARRSDDELPFIDQTAIGGQALLLDTCVYIDRLQGKAPLLLKHMMAARHNNHSTVCIQELAHTIGVLDPKDPRSPAVQKTVAEVIRSIPVHRILTPDADILGRAAVMSGVLCRLQGYSQDQKRKCLQDCVLYLQALKYGLLLISRNISDFDYCLQLIPTGNVVFYR